MFNYLISLLLYIIIIRNTVRNNYKYSLKILTSVFIIPRIIKIMTHIILIYEITLKLSSSYAFEFL